MVTAGPDPAPLEVADPTALLDIRAEPPALTEAFASATSASIGVAGEVVAGAVENGEPQRPGTLDRHRDGLDPRRFRPVLLGLQPRARRLGRPGDAGRRRDGLPAVLGHLPHDPRPVRRRRGRSGDDHLGRDPRHDPVAQRSVFGLSQLRRLRQEPPRRQRPVRGRRCRDRRRSPDGTKGCTPLGTTCRLVVTRPIPGSPADRAGVAIGDVIVADGRSVRPRPDTERGSRPDPWTEGIGRDADDQARDDSRLHRPDHPRRRPGAGGPHRFARRRTPSGTSG